MGNIINYLSSDKSKSLIIIFSVIILFLSFTHSKHYITYDKAISEHWDEIKDYIDGTETIEACSEESGNCYYVKADISNGIIERIYFSNGGYLDFFAEIDEDGSAWDFDKNGNSWDFTIDINSPIIEDAVYEWAGDNNYEIE